MSCTAYDTKTTKNLLHFLRSQTRLISNNKPKKKKQQFGLVELSCQNLDSQTIIFRQSIKRLNIFLGKQTESKKI